MRPQHVAMCLNYYRVLTAKSLRLGIPLRSDVTWGDLGYATKFSTCGVFPNKVFYDMDDMDP